MSDILAALRDPRFDGPLNGRAADEITRLRMLLGEWLEAAGQPASQVAYLREQTREALANTRSPRFPRVR